MDTEKLKQIGFNDNEARVYLALLELEDSLVSEISNKTKINRSLLYSILDSLVEKGIVTYILKNNVRYYRAAEPTKVLSILKEKERILKSILPELISLHKPRKNRPVIEILEGKEGIKTVLNDIIKQKKECYVFNVPGKSPEILKFNLDNFHLHRQKEKIPIKVIFVKTKKAIERSRIVSKMKYAEVKFMPEEFDSPASNWVYKDRIVILFWYSEFPFAVRIIDKNLAESYKNHFKALWSISKETI